jgi:hypothetical protein
MCFSPTAEGKLEKTWIAVKGNLPTPVKKILCWIIQAVPQESRKSPTLSVAMM